MDFMIELSLWDFPYYKFIVEAYTPEKAIEEVIDSIKYEVIDFEYFLGLDENIYNDPSCYQTSYVFDMKELAEMIRSDEFQGVYGNVIILQSSNGYYS